LTAKLPLKPVYRWHTNPKLYSNFFAGAKDSATGINLVNKPGKVACSIDDVAGLYAHASF